MTKEQQEAPFSNLADALAASVSLDVKPDHTFHMTAFLLPIDGTWTMKARRVFFTPTQVFGESKPADTGSLKVESGSRPSGQSTTHVEPFEVEVSPDGLSLNPVGNGSDNDKRGDFTFTKQP